MYRLFIRPFDRAYPLKAVLITLLAIVVLMPLVDGAFRVLIEHITKEPPSIMEFQNVYGAQSLWQLLDEGISPVVFTGTSETNLAVDPQQFDQLVQSHTEQSIQSVNLSYTGAFASINRDIIRNLLIPSGVKTVIYGVEPNAFKDNAAIPMILERYTSKPLGYALSRPSKLERTVLLWLLRYSALMDYHDNVAEWLSGRRAVDDIGFPFSYLEDRGFMQVPLTDKRDLSDTQRLSPYMPDFQSALMDTAQACFEATVHCILMIMPNHPLIHKVLTVRDMQIFHEMLYHTDLPVWDFDTVACETMLGEESFLNINHLNTVGAAKFTALLADVYTGRTENSCAQISESSGNASGK